MCARILICKHVHKYTRRNNIYHINHQTCFVTQIYKFMCIFMYVLSVYSAAGYVSETPLITNKENRLP